MVNFTPKTNHFIKFTLMKTIFKLLSLVCAAGILFSACEPSTPEVTYKDYPMESVSVVVGDETAVGVINDADKAVVFVFNNAETFSNVDLVVGLNEGWTLTFPTTLTGVNLEEMPILNFESPTGQIVKYNVSFSSNAFPIVNPNKIQVRGLEEGKNLTIDNASKTITIRYDRDVMNFNNIEIVFNEGALQAGVTVPEDLTYDFAEGNVQQLVLNLGGERPYKVILDVTAYISATPESMGFQDVTANYNLTEEQKAIVKVLKAEAIAGLPVPVLKYIDEENPGTLHNPNYDWTTYTSWLYGSSNPRYWEVMKPDWSGHGDTKHEDDIFSMPGDWKLDRPTMNCYGNIYVVTMELGKVSADIQAVAGGLDVQSVEGLVVTSGWNVDEASLNYLVYADGQVVNQPDAGANSAYRASIGVKDGKVSFQTVAQNSNDLYVVPFQTSTPEVESTVAAATEKWDVSDAAWVAGWGVRDGKALKISDIINNDGNQWVSDTGVLGMGWSMNFYAPHNLVGVTYDGKLAFMINDAGYCNWDGIADYVNVDNQYAPYNEWGFSYHGYSLKQMFYIAHQLGWKDAAVLGNGTDASPMKPILKVNGISLTGNTESQIARYALTVNAK